jgi:FHA domain-containing protein
MEYSNLIASLYPYDDDIHHYAKDVIKNCTLHSQESKDEDEDNLELQLTFSHRPKGPQGFTFGSSRQACDIPLPLLDTVSHRHCYLTFDSQKRLVLRNISKKGTVVTYDGQGGERRSNLNFTWIIGGDETADKIKEIIIEFDQYLKFRIVVPKTRPGIYVEKVHQFNISLLDELNLQSAKPTTAPSRDQDAIPESDHLFLKIRLLGSGSFADVHLVWDASTGLTYASKEPRPGNKFDIQRWKDEKEILEQISHVS